MGRNGHKVTPEEGEKIMECLERGMTPREMSPTIRRSANCIYQWLRANGVELPRKGKHHPNKVYTMADELDYSKLPKDLMFDYKMFPSF